MYLIRSVFYLILPFSFALVSIGHVVSVDKVKFKSLEDNWLMAEVDISAGLNTLPNANYKKFVENVDVRLYLAFKERDSDSNLDYFYSEVSILAMERGDKNTVRFYIPGKIMKMKRHNKPDYYYAELVVGQSPLEPRSRAYSSKFQNQDSLVNFVSKVKAGSFKNYGRLIPSYLTPSSVSGGDPDAPVYLIRVKN